eukprot:CAMPEP_0114578842 /NCGR_PEP_ID=MMETSP0125-20121206/3336_1 /TAXON_ID=485358 ORGANISM="Aristerostoma sp., Strain ATCC 50986" /NCGR_SAMPLE_ID=MMETSP0125 /ASSEMBLY_ACC=CAM_ASM_000245 /LENGTH=37 /DNA_ID= /DNA_START= /DNA_END= /DNA_ORIENTATION=
MRDIACHQNDDKKSKENPHIDITPEISMRSRSKTKDL